MIPAKDFPPCFSCNRPLSRLRVGTMIVLLPILDGHVTVFLCRRCIARPRIEDSCERKLRRLMNREPAFWHGGKGGKT